MAPADRMHVTCHSSHLLVSIWAGEHVVRTEYRFESTSTDSPSSGFLRV